MQKHDIQPLKHWMKNIILSVLLLALDIVAIKQSLTLKTSLWAQLIVETTEVRMFVIPFVSHDQLEMTNL